MATGAREKIGPGGVAKRVLVGRAVSTHRLEHTLLPKFLALPVFSSDAMSSVIYAPQEVLIALLVFSATSAHLELPVAIAIATLMAIVVASYRQTVKAYPNGGGAYIVSKDNLGTAPGLAAAAALLVDYVLTVAVQVAAGVYAITSVDPILLKRFSVVMSIGFVLFIMLVNLRGAKESGWFFAPPVYLFIVSIFVMVAVGVSRCVFSHCPIVTGLAVTPDPHLATIARSMTIFVILKAFSSGCAALTGVEAISNGVTAFKRPQSKNAAQTLLMMGALAIVMFTGIAFLASRAHVIVGDRSVVSQVAYAVFHGGAGFYIVQVFSAAILLLGANTSFQDFPRLSAILAKDRFMPRQFMNRGDRLVFSNGIIALAFAGCALIVWANADVNRLIQLYVVGVFTSFTMSQTGMVKHWLKERKKGGKAAAGWQRSIAFNALGAATTFVVVIVVTLSKFTQGAWISILGMVILAFSFWFVHLHYESVMAQLRRGRVTVGGVGLNHVVLLVRELDDAMVEALGYVRSVRPTDLRAVLPTGGGGVPMDLQERWRKLAVGYPDLEPLPVEDGHLLAGIRDYIHGIPCRRRDFITVVVPEVLREEGLVSYLVRRRSLVRLKAGLLREPNVVVADVPVLAGEKVAVGVGGRPLIPQRTVALVFVSAIHDATVRAVNYAQALEASETRAIYFDLDPDQTSGIGAEWAERGLGIPLDIVEAPFRDLTVPMLAEVRGFTERPDTLVMVVVPEFVVTKWRHMLLHNQSALFLKQLMLSEPRVVLASVPFSLEA